MTNRIRVQSQSGRIALNGVETSTALLVLADGNERTGYRLIPIV